MGWEPWILSSPGRGEARDKKKRGTNGIKASMNVKGFVYASVLLAPTSHLHPSIPYSIGIRKSHSSFAFKAHLSPTHRPQPVGLYIPRLHPHEVSHPASPSIGDKTPSVHSSRGLLKMWRKFPQISVTTKYIKSTILIPFHFGHRGGKSCNLTSYSSCYVQELTRARAQKGESGS